ncbi:MAG: VCBS repeat-containing protein, partial [Paraprevotella sp.]|nr:VCBS repeat-containing protein [Paraprevotella sp.]
VNYAYLASGFTTTEVTVTDGYETGIQAPEKQTGVKVDIEGNVITVNSPETATVAIYNMQGAEVATGMTNTPITVNGRGVFIVKTNQKVIKIVK